MPYALMSVIRWPGHPEVLGRGETRTDGNLRDEEIDRGRCAEYRSPGGGLIAAVLS
jgi:hypothetical protein